MEFLEENIRYEVHLFSKEEKEDLKVRILKLKCVNCNSDDVELVGDWVKSFFSIIYILRHIVRHKLLCPSCLRKEKRDALRMTLIAGWWSVFGVFLTPIYMLKYMFRNKGFRTNEILELFIEEHMVPILKNDGDETTLYKLIKSFNDPNLEIQEQEIS